MDFDDSPAEAAMRLSAREWLRAHARERTESGTSLMRAYRPRTTEEDDAIVARARAWQGLKAEHGWVGLHWPVAYGGRGHSAGVAAVFAEEEARFDVPGRFFQVGVDMVGPTIIEFGDDAQRTRHLPGILNGDAVWCQLFSEPGAGSDLASLSTRAVRDGDEFVVNGQKVWTTGAHYSDWAILLVRTDPDAPKHAGITYLLLDMTTPGIDVRPLRQIDGGLHFNEVFLTDVRVPVDHVLGGIGNGWAVARRTLGLERTAIGGGGMVDFDQLRELVALCGSDTPRLVDLYIRDVVIRLLGFGVRTDRERGRPPGPGSSVLKLAVSAFYEAAGNLIMEAQGAAGMLWADDAMFDGAFSGIFLSQWAPRIGGGTDEIQRNVIAERVLGLPRDR